MKLVHRSAGGGAALFGAVLFGAMSAGCTTDQTGFFILGNVALDAPQCVARAESSSTLLSSGLLDVGLKLDYEATLLVGSQLAPRGDKANLRTETMIATITGAEVHLNDDVGEPATDPFTVPAAGVITPDSADTPGFGVVTATLMPATFGNGLAGNDPGQVGLGPGEVRTFVAKVIVFGKTIGGLEIETAPLSYVIRACQGCLVDFPADAIQMDLTTGAAYCGAAAADQAQVSPCRVGQDNPVDCRLCSGDGNPFCIYPGGPP